MSPEKPTKNTNAQKQKIMIVAIVVIVGAMGWLMFGGGGSSSGDVSSPTAGSNMAMNNGSKSLPNNSNMGGMNNTTANTNAPAPEMMTPKPAMLSINSEILKVQQQSQADYLQSVTKLQMLKIQREIDETKTAIAAAELSRMTAEKSIADLITSKEGSGGGDMGPIGGQPSSPYGSPPPFVSQSNNSGGGNGNSNGATSAAVASPVSMLLPQEPIIPYALLSVVYNGKWRAVLSNNGKKISVKVGDVLEDGSTVSTITKNGLVLARDKKQRALAVPSTF